MKKNMFLLACITAILFSCKKEEIPAALNATGATDDLIIRATGGSYPVTAVSFPKEVIPVEGGRIEFWAMLTGYGGAITTGGYDPHFFQIYDGKSNWQMGFNANDGAGNSGIVGVAGNRFYCGSGGYTYENIFGTGNVNKWHHYVFIWDKNGLKCLNDVNKKQAIYIDGKLKTSSWHGLFIQKFVPLTDGVFNLITTAGPKTAVQGYVTMDELKIYDKHNKLILWNTLGSVDEITNSKVGLNGSFNGGGNATFVAGKSGNAVMAEPVGGL